MPQDKTAARDVERIAVRGLKAHAEIIVDRWGIPHIRAGSASDAFFVQGFNAARDRLWQIDLWRKRGLGLLAADFGPGYLAQDRAARLFLYRGDMAAEWAAYGLDAQNICQSFAEGINAFIDLAEREPGRLPPEFGLLGTMPARWRADDVVRIRSHGLTRNALSEILRSVILARADPATDLLRKKLEPAVAPRIPDGVDLGAISIDILDVVKLAMAQVTFTPDRLAASLDEVWAWTKVSDLSEVIRDAEFEGSNSWAVHGSLTASGRPILASDPHRTHAVPSLRYLVHLTAPDLDVIGAGEPSAPAISIGHNGSIAFGLTIFGADQEDIYVYRTTAEDRDAYAYADGRERMQVIGERFAVKGAADQILQLKFTRHGPVIFEDPCRLLAYAVRSVWREPGTAAYLGSIGAIGARDFEEFRAAMRRWGAPSVNQVYADTSGRIAWMPVGLTPVRRNWDGLLPIAGDGRHEWDGFLAPETLPGIVDPPCGFVASANEMNLPDGWDHARFPVGFEWGESARAARIREVLGNARRQSVETSCDLQTDVVSMPARRLIHLFDALNPGDGAAAAAINLLRGWNGRLASESGPAALFEVWWTAHLKPAVLSRLAPDETIRKLLAPGDADTILGLIEAPDGRFGGHPSEARDRLLIETLGRAYADCGARLGEDLKNWAWGLLHQGFFEHGLSNLPASKQFPVDVGPLAMGGSGSTPMHAGYRPSDFRVIAGASVRLVIDVGDWDRSLCMNAPGQSGDPRSAHYSDLATLWASGHYVPLLYTSAAIDDAASKRIELVPAS